MTKSKNFTLTMDLTPHFMSGSALRKHVSEYRWRKIIRPELIAARGPNCEICHFTAIESKRIEAHEIFEYGDNSIKLAAIQLLCTRCHDIKDFAQTERLIAKGVKETQRRQVVVDHFCRVNECTLAEFDAHYADARRRLQEIELRFGPSITPDQIHYGDYQHHHVKAQDPARFTGLTAAAHAIAAAIKRGAVHEDYRETALEIAKENSEFCDEILRLVKNGDIDAAAALVVETIGEYCDDGFEMYPDHECPWDVGHAD